MCIHLISIEMTEILREVKLKKSPNDKADYLGLVLGNKMKVALIRYPIFYKFMSFKYVCLI